MSFIAKALFIVMMRQDSGNSTVASESVSVVESMEECRSAMRVFQSTKGEQKYVNSGNDKVSFTAVSESWAIANTKYTLECKPLGE